MNTFCFAGELEKAEAMFQKFPSEFRTERVSPKSNNNLYHYLGFGEILRGLQ